MNPRDLWSPQRKELPVQCASCPFLEGNPKEFGAVVNRLRARFGLSPATPWQVMGARVAIKEDLEDANSGDFICHGTAYTPEMGRRPETEYRQCPGATAYFKGKPCAAGEPGR